MYLHSIHHTAVPRLMGKLIDQRSSSSSSNKSNSFLSNILWVGLVGGTASLVRTVMLNQAEDNIAARLRKEAFKSLLTERDLEWFHMEDATRMTLAGEDGGTLSKDQAAEKTSKATTSSSSSIGMTPAAISVILKDDVDTVAHTITATLANLLRSTSSCIFGTYHMLCLNPTLVGLSLGVAPLVGTLAWISRKRLKTVLAIQQQAAMDAASFLEEKLNHIAMVKMANREAGEVESFARIQDEYIKLGKQSALANGMSMGAMFAMSTTALCGILFAGGKAVDKGRMNHGELVSFGTYSFMLALGSAGVVKALSEYMNGLTCAVRLHRLMDSSENLEQTSLQSTEIQSKATTVNVDFADVQDIALESVFFSYKSDQINVVLRNVSLKLPRGEVITLVGKNGSGKSTLASLLAGLYQPSSGSIVVHESGKGIDYAKELDRQSQAKLVQVVPQSPALFNTSILENVRYSRPESSDQEVLEAIKTANCDGFVSKLDGGIEYRVGRNGSRLSGGQRQRLGLARALLSDPVLLVLDEPASSLDSEGETAVAEAIEACRSSNRALLVISHRSKTLELADRVVVLKDGAVVESGTFKELQQMEGSELCKLMPDLL
jgi:ABC-type multidrug transport system fused ATPase/permease subunit